MGPKLDGNIDKRRRWLISTKNQRPKLFPDVSVEASIANGYDTKTKFNSLLIIYFFEEKFYF